MASASLVGALLFGLGLQSRIRSRVTTALGLVLVGLTLVVLVSAWYRLDLYQLAYGWTELRFYALAGIVFLGLALAILGWCVVAARMQFALQPVFAAALLVALGVNALSPSAFVARADLQRQIDPSGLPADAERRMDAPYLISLGDGAYPVLVDLLPGLPPADRDLLWTRLRTIAERRVEASEPWESFNADRARAKIALETVR
jgi:signal transduction histidine kinase